ncbi:MAG: 2,4-dihydroxyhept-2-ene-1,7-dioic acid aldolase [Acidimicrobiia bacterium]|nr:2,4-dihydroxyhept-2-ene-1,7-dioic acid aldolase [Acidimicrobiia bacterium]NNL47888.1 2,4-dihydroxyhept-2-ene-1,7-dioic acid aldolase [Acidimicrobiia bacterium]
MPTSMAAEAMASVGLDYVCIDMQHGLVDYSDSVGMLQAITTGSSTPTVRVPENQASHIGKALDAGAMAVIVPMVNTIEQCQAAVAAARYAPEGSRSFGPTRAAPVEGDDYWERANTDVALIPMIETVQALENLEGILSVPGVEAIYVGPADLSISMGFQPRSNEPEFLAALDRIVEACARNDVVPGMHTNVALAQDRLERGFRMLTITADLVALRSRIAEDVAMVRRGQTRDTTALD